MADTEDRRSTRRSRTLLEGRIAFNSRLPALDCVVRDLSETGARIYCSDIPVLPPEFELEIPKKGLRVQARVVWSRGANHGVEFREQANVSPRPLRVGLRRL